jgi:rhamnosyltransferase
LLLSSIVIRAKNEALHIGETLESVFSQQSTGPIEVIVVDSGSTDATLDIVQRFPVQLIEIPAESFTYGRSLNIGIAASRGDVIVSLSAHTLPIGSGWLTSLINPLSEPNVCGVYGRQVPRVDAGRLEVFGMWFTGVSSDRRRIHRSNPMFSNANGAFRRRLWEEEPFDEDVAGAEDLAWVRIMLRRGYVVVFEPEACAYHSHGVPLGRHIRQIARDFPTVAQSMLGIGGRGPAPRVSPRPSSHLAE